MTEILAGPGRPVRASFTEPSRWQDSLKNAVRTADELLSMLNLAEVVHPSESAAEQFPLFATREFISRIEPGNPHDPLLRQVLPISEEMQIVDGFSADPLHEADATLESGLLHKYHGRALLVTTGACAIHCRYCFRRHFPYSSVPHSIKDWQPALEAIERDGSIEEILLSGGDPLMLVDSLLDQLVDAIGQIPHVRRLRIHSRLPIVLPSRVTDDLVGILRESRMTVVVVVHANHVREIDASVTDAFAKLVDTGIPVLNQSVLLRGVNDSADAMADLCSKLVDHRVMPYYLHRLDPVAGTAHFEVSQSEGKAIIDAMRTRLPGYAVPRFVIEQPGHLSKTILR